MKFVDKNLNREIEAVGIHKNLPANTVMMNPGDTIQFIPIVEKGSIRVVLQNKKGDEYYLYHLYPGETCAMSLTCCQSQRTSEVKAVVEDDAELLMIGLSRQGRMHFIRQASECISFVFIYEPLVPSPPFQ